MNKNTFVEQLTKKMDLNIEKCNDIYNILDSNFVISKQSKKKIIESLMQELSYNYEEANKIYWTSIEIIKGLLKGIKN